MHQLGVGPEFVRQAVITHAHPDHVMAVPLLREMFPGCDLGLRRGGRNAWRGEGGGLLPPDRRRLDRVLHKDGVDRRHADPPLPLAENRIAVDRAVGEGDVDRRRGHLLDACWRRPATAIAASACTTRPADAGDLRRHGLLHARRATTWWPNYFTGYAAYVASMERLAALDAEVLCLSHNGADGRAEDVRDLLRRCDCRHAAVPRADRGRDESRASPSRQIAEELGAEIHRQTPVLPLDFFQKNCGLLVKQSLK